MNPNNTDKHLATIKPLLQVQHLVKYFPIRQGVFGKTVGHVKAVDDISFNLYPGETLGLVGESGCGKSTAGRTILKLIPATSGEVYFEDSPNILTLKESAVRPYRQYLQMIFQDPFSSLNPRMNVGSIVGEGIRVFGKAKGAALQDRVAYLLESVGIKPDYANRYPHEFSGGQRQRIGIARALALEPKLIIADEPVSSLDVSIQAQILNLLKDIQSRFNLSYLFISHDLRVVEHFCDRITVMYLGKMVETADRVELYSNPLHPYTKALLSSVPIPDPKIKRQRIVLQGDVPSPANPPSGCRFHTRCPIAQFPLCKTQEPLLEEKSTGHCVACHLVN